MQPNSDEEAKTSKASRRCARCRNHGLQISVAGHKRYCRYRYCACDLCRRTGFRQRDMALQTASRRAQAQDEARILEAGESAAESSVIEPHVVTSTNSKPFSCLSVDQVVDQESSSNGKSLMLKIIFRFKFLSRFSRLAYHWAMADQIARDNNFSEAITPFLCALIKSRNGNLDEAQKFLDEGKIYFTILVKKIKENYFNFLRESGCC